MYSYVNLNQNNSKTPIKKYRQLIEYSNFYQYENCTCKPEIFKKTSTEPNSSNSSRNMRISNTIQSNYGGRPRFIDLTNTAPITLNYLGRLEGMPGGGGSPIKNKF
jgi:uncharacterized Zn-finger protein